MRTLLHPLRQLVWTPWVDGDDVWIRIDKGRSGGSCCPTTGSGNRRGSGADGSMVLTGDEMGCGYFQLLLQAVRGAALCQPTVALEEFPLLRRFARAVRTWKSGLRLRPRIFQSFWCLGVACGVRRIFGTRALLGSTVDTFSTGGFGRISHIFYVAADSDPEAFFLHFVLNGEICTVAASGCSFSQRASHVGI